MNKSTLAYTTKSLAIINMLLFLIVTTLSCSHGKNSEVAFQELYSNSGQYNGKAIIIEGFYFQGFEIQVIAERLEYSGYAYDHLVPKGEMIWVEGEIPREVYEALYLQSMMGPEERYGKVRMTGKFEYGGKYGHLGAYDSQIVPSEVELLEWSRPEP